MWQQNAIRWKFYFFAQNNRMRSETCNYWFQIVTIGFNAIKKRILTWKISNVSPNRKSFEDEHVENSIKTWSTCKKTYKIIRCLSVKDFQKYKGWFKLGRGGWFKSNENGCHAIWSLQGIAISKMSCELFQKEAVLHRITTGEQNIIHCKHLKPKKSW